MLLTAEKREVRMPCRVAWLANCIPPYTVPLFKALASRLDEFRLFLSVDMEANRHWRAHWDGLDVRVQKTVTLRRTWRHPHGFSEEAFVHVPYDTFYSLKSYKPDVVISAELGSRTLQALAYRCAFPRSRLLVRACLSEVTEQGRGIFRDWLRKQLLPRIDAVMVNGRSGAKYARRFKVASDKLFFTPTTTDLGKFYELPLERSKETSYRLLYVGRLVELKGVMPFAETISRWASGHPNVRVDFWLAGDGPLKFSLTRMKFPPNVTVQFLGNISYEDLPRVYAQGGILVLPTLADEWGMVVNEALAAGLPVLGSLYSQAVEELVQDGVNGWTFRANQPKEMYLALDLALNSSADSLFQMRSAARESVEDLTPEFVADRIVEAIRFAYS